MTATVPPLSRPAPPAPTDAAQLRKRLQSARNVAVDPDAHHADTIAEDLEAIRYDLDYYETHLVKD